MRIPYRERAAIFSRLDEEQRPRCPTLFEVLRDEGNWRCFMLTAIVLSCMTSLLRCHFCVMESEATDLDGLPIWESICEKGFVYVTIAVMLLAYLAFMVDCYNSDTWFQLSRKVDISNITSRILALRTAIPNVWWKAICYHYEKRKRQVTRYRNGEPYVTTQAYYVRINSHTATSGFSYESCGFSDFSKNLIVDIPKPIIKIRFSKTFAFSNFQAAREFHEQRNQFFEEYENFDTYTQMKEWFNFEDIGGHGQYSVAYRDVHRWAWYSSQLFFWIMSFIMLSWPLRIWTEYNTACIHYTIIKIFGTNYDLDPSQQTDLDTQLSDTLSPVPTSNYASPVHDEQITVLGPTTRPNRILSLSTTSTVDSLELFAAIRGNCALVPSYSEALTINAALPEDPEENASEATNVRSTSLHRPTQLPNTEISFNVSNTDNGHNEQNSANSSCYVIEDVMPEQLISNQYIPLCAQPHCSTTQGLLFFSNELSSICPRDPFGGQQQTTPIDEPPSYNEALMLPCVQNITRSTSGTEMNGSRAVFIRDLIANRMSGIEGVGAFSDAQVVRIPLHEPCQETAV